MNPNSFPDLAPKVHFTGLSFSWNFINLKNNFLKTCTCSSSVQDLAIMSST
ncbi:hypothetical protein ES319_A10G202100v1 [Gossypium barbadense]|uniref:Uncharacterized protein n=1 Tax=Gossypium barbadense TaxID=3634 RepID=A0A5J5U7F9_GOSBA|nr:hypothetical protein ES319_A10G202100v1 [Gossypium barbadense]